MQLLNAWDTKDAKIAIGAILELFLVTFDQVSQLSLSTRSGLTTWTGCHDWFTLEKKIQLVPWEALCRWWRPLLPDSQQSGDRISGWSGRRWRTRSQKHLNRTWNKQIMMCLLHIGAGATKPRISKMLNVQESQKNGCFNTIMNGTAFFLPCHSGSIFSDWNLQFGQDKI